MRNLGRWIACAALVAGCGGGKAAPKKDPIVVAPDAAPAVEEPDMAVDAGEELEVTGIQPTTGEVGTDVVIFGKGFTYEGRSVSVYFGAKKANVKNVTDTEITVTAPKASAGDVVDIAVKFEPGGEMRLSDAFSYPDE